ncbi:MAG TPA: hypothetical protein VJ464_13750 [Blastocatellia bacterium]|nr:hypothetical protein [Blastocatellia bacterium]
MPDNIPDKISTRSFVITAGNKAVLDVKYDLDGIFDYIISYLRLARSEIQQQLIDNGIELEEAAELVDFARDISTQEKHEEWLRDYLHPAGNYILKYLPQTILEAVYKLTHEAVVASLYSVARQKNENTFTNVPTQMANIISLLEQEQLKKRLDVPGRGHPIGNLYFNGKVDFEKKLREAIKKARGEKIVSFNQELVAEKMTYLLPNYRGNLDARTLRMWCKQYHPGLRWNNLVKLLESQNSEDK